MDSACIQIDESQLQRLLTERAEDLRSMLTRKIPTRFRPFVAAEDVLQEAWITAFRTFSSFRPTQPDAFDRWLSAIATRRLADALRAAGTLKRGGVERVLGENELGNSRSYVDLFGRLTAAQRTPSRELSAREMADTVHVALCGLAEPRRRAVHMRYIEGRSRAEIARALRKSDSAVNSLLYNGLRDLRARLGAACQYFSGGSSSVEGCAPAGVQDTGHPGKRHAKTEARHA